MRRLQKARKTTAKMGGLCEERSEKGRGGRNVDRKQGRPQLRWEDCVKRDLRKAEEEENWREMKANNRDQWKQIIKVAVHR